MQERDPADMARLGARVAALTQEDAETFAGTDPAEFADHGDVGRAFADRAVAEWVVCGEAVRPVDEFGSRTNSCAFLTLTHPAFSGGPSGTMPVADRSSGSPRWRYGTRKDSRYG